MLRGLRFGGTQKKTIARLPETLRRVEATFSPYPSPKGGPPPRGEGFDRAAFRRLAFRPARSGAFQRLVRAGDGIQGWSRSANRSLSRLGRRWPGRPDEGHSALAT